MAGIVGLPYLVIDALLSSLIEDGTHESLHAIVDIYMNGTLGAVNRLSIRAAFTPPKQARMGVVYTTGHFPHQLAAAAVPPLAPPGRPHNLAAFPDICKCFQCFRFLHTHGLISASGFTQTRRSYLLYAAVSDNGDVPLYIVHNLLNTQLLFPQLCIGGVWQMFATILDALAPHERAMKLYISRLQAFYAIAVPAPGFPNHNPDIGLFRRTRMAGWIDPATATILQGWNVDIAPLVWPTRGTMFHAVIAQQNRHRHTMLPWLHANMPAGWLPWNQSYNTTTNPAGGMGYHLTPLGVAIYKGDVRSVHVLASLPGINFGQHTPIALGGGALRWQTNGAAVAYALTWKAHEAFKAWLSYAAPLMEHANQTDQIENILRLVLEQCSAKRVAISGEVLPVATLIGAHKKSKSRRRQMLLDVALAVIYTVQELSFHTSIGAADGTITVVKMYEMDWYINWVARIKRENRTPATRFCRDVVPLLNALDRRAQRTTRSGRNFADV